MTTKQLVKHFTQDQRAVDDRAWLTAKIWAYELGRVELTDKLYAVIKQVPNQEDIFRAHRRLREKGEITYSPEVEKRVYKKYQDKTAEYSNKVQQTLRRFG